VDPVSIYCVCFVGRNELLTGNGAGQMKLWDLRHSESSLVQTMNPMNELYGAVSIAQHPSQSHLVVVGYGCGSMDLWDLRMGSGCDPVVNLCAEGGSLNEIYFHKVNPDNFFTASQTGQVWQWYPTDKNPEFLNGKVMMMMMMCSITKGIMNLIQDVHFVIL
jgi:WD40 repeat protein